MNSLIIEANDDKYLVRYQFFKSVVSRKHTTKEGKIINRLEKHPNSCEIFLYKLDSKVDWSVDFYVNNTRKLTCLEALITFPASSIKQYCNSNLLTYLGHGLSKCSNQDKFNKTIGIITAINNISDLDPKINQDINIFNSNLKILVGKV